MCTQTHTVHTHTAITVVWFRLEGGKKLSGIEFESRQEHPQVWVRGSMGHGAGMSPGSSLGHSGLGEEQAVVSAKAKSEMSCGLGGKCWVGCETLKFEAGSYLGL